MSARIPHDFDHPSLRRRPLVMAGWIVDPRGRRIAPDLAPHRRFVTPDPDPDTSSNNEETRHERDH